MKLKRKIKKYYKEFLKQYGRNPLYKEWLVKEGYPEFMNMTRDNLEIILIRFAQEKCAEQREICNKEMSKLDCGDPNFMDFGLKTAPEPDFS